MRAAHVHEVELELDPGRRRERVAAARSPSSARRSSIDPIQAGIYPLAAVTTPRAHRHRRRTGPRLAARREAALACRARAGSRPRSRPWTGSARSWPRPRPRSGSRRSATCSGTSPTATATAPTCARSPSCAIGEQATVMVEVRSARVRPTRRRNLRIVEATVADDSGPMKAVWFNQAWLAERLRPGTRLLLNGKLDRSGFRVADARDRRRRRRAGAGASTRPGSSRSTPRPRSSARAAAARVGLAGGRSCAGDAIEPLPAELRARRRLAGAADALRCAHFPESPERGRARPASGSPSRSSSCTRRRSPPAAQRAASARPGDRRSSAPGELVARLARVAAVRADRATSGAAFDEIDADLAAGRPMQRLLMGEVGSGKTVVAALRDAAGARGRPPGGADGADRDARRAARRDARRAARRGSRDPVRAADRRDAGGAAPRDARPARQRASSGWSSAPTR